MSETTTGTLADFLLARIGEDELLAGTAPVVRFSDNPRVESHSPARVLAECEAKRRIVELHRASETPGPSHSRSRVEAEGMAYAALLAIKFLAAVYADHPDFQENWRV